MTATASAMSGPNAHGNPDAIADPISNATPRGTVYGTLMNFRGEWDALGATVHQPPYNAPPRAPVLYVKPANTWSENGTAIAVPAHVAQVDIGATVAMVIGQRGAVVGCVLMNDLSIPHDSFFRPPVKFKCLDGFLGIGSTVCAVAAMGDTADAANSADLANLANLAHLELQVRINGELVQTVRFAQLLRPAAQLLADVSAFMTLGPGDMLMLGCDVGSGGRPRGRVGDRIEVSAPLLGTLTNILVAEAA